ncbi:hypothetical protein CEXT_391921 [Caerostris extrusa]|uniref:Uncharacterized protein n=1 Tax=Caerostris extrusa TaxID=172846 RepID=A0AAV4WC04_CAEEX|nr:hypothetical protein CEXT_391921 [Caerostris extrusa]
MKSSIKIPSPQGDGQIVADETEYEFSVPKHKNISILIKSIDCQSVYLSCTNVGEKHSIDSQGQQQVGSMKQGL